MDRVVKIEQAPLVRTVGSAVAWTWNLATRRGLALKAATGEERGLMLTTGAAGRTEMVCRAAILNPMLIASKVVG